MKEERVRAGQDETGVWGSSPQWLRAGTAPVGSRGDYLTEQKIIYFNDTNTLLKSFNKFSESDEGSLCSQKWGRAPPGAAGTRGAVSPAGL